MSKRISLSTRRTKDNSIGVDAIIRATQPTPKEKDSSSVAKVTLYLRPEQVSAVEEIQVIQRKRTGTKPSKSDLYQEALDMLIAKYMKN